MLRRLALALTLIAGSLQAEDATPLEVPECSDSDREGELELRSDGTIARWDLVRILLHDLEAGPAGPEWLEMPAVPPGPGALTLRNLGGRAVTAAGGEALGVVRGCLVDTDRGRVLALDVDVGPSCAGESRRVALPFGMLEARDGSLRWNGDLDWIRDVPSIGAD